MALIGKFHFNHLTAPGRIVDNDEANGRRDSPELLPQVLMGFVWDFIQQYRVILFGIEGGTDQLKPFPTFPEVPAQQDMPLLELRRKVLRSSSSSDRRR